MVTRKPVPPPNGVPPTGNHPLPYPLSPSSPRSNQPFGGDAQTEDNVWSSEQRPITTRPAAPYPRDSTADIPGINDGWTDLGGNSEGDIDRSSLPAPLKINKQKSTESIGQHQDVPPSLRSGQLVITPKSSWETDRSIEDAFSTQETQHPPPPVHAPPEVSKISTNPFHRAPSVERTPQVPWEPPNGDGSNIWAELAENPTPSTNRPPLHQRFEDLKLNEKPSELLPAASEHQPPPPHVGGDETLISFDPAQDYQQELPRDPFGPSQEQDPWEMEESAALSSPKGKEKEIDLPAEATENPFELPKLETDLGSDLSAQPLSRPQPSSPALERKIVVSEEVANRQRGETYQIKHVRWLDSSSQETKTTPILIQNKNGPCPLLALVNALTLLTPSSSHTGLIETLRVREQISLGLLLDAVFDELMSGRRGDAAQELPDVGELYAFLITLHTGMNVNPRFVPMRRKEHSLVDGLESEVPLTLQDYRRPGAFEHTKEMLLYGTFSVPLMHGWIPAKSHQAFAALERSAQSYEDAQNLLFREEELEDKLQASGLSHDEQQMLEDIASIKYFLNSSATQLTGYGLDIIHDTLKPGEIVILFRNDHFSTLYKHPRSGQLLQLITDAGYSGHDEVVWESLVDVHGEGTEFFSGDFRPVSHGINNGPSQQQAFELARDDSSGWQTVGRNSRKAATGPASPSSTDHRPLPGLPPRLSGSTSVSGGTTEQEDADLALAMQLQEEEEDRSRRSNAARQRENELSKAYLSSQNLPVRHLDSNSNSNSPSSSSSPATNSRRSTQTVRPLLPPRRDHTTTANARQPVHRETAADTADDDAPPSYEQAAKSEPYHPPSEPAALGGGSGAGPTISQAGQAGSRPPQPQNQNLPEGGRPRGQSAYSATNTNLQSASGQRRRSAMPGSYGGSSGSYQDLGVTGGMSRRRSAGTPGPSAGGAGAEERREKDCAVM